jgi:hypothetical protein
MADRPTLQQLVNGYGAAQAIHVAAVLGIADRLAAGPKTANELADAAGAHPDSLYRLLRALASIGVLEERDERRFALAELGQGLRSDAPRSLSGWAAFIGRPPFWESWGALLHSVRTGENAFRHVHGQSVWEYRAARPEEQAVFDGAMASMTGAANAAILDAYDFGQFRTVVDVGGGNGTLLGAILERHGAVRGLLFDQPHVATGAEETLAPFADRCRTVGGSFFDSVPTGGDAYVLKAIIHDWEDHEAIAILSVCREAMAPGAAAVIIERDLGPPNADPDAKFSDLNMLVNPGGRERTYDEYRRLCDQAGLRLAGSTPTASGWAVFEARLDAR